MPDLYSMATEIDARVLDPDPIARDFRRLFPQASPTFGEKHLGKPDPREYFAAFRAEFYGRYVLELEVPFHLSEGAVSPAGGGRLSLNEYTDPQPADRIAYHPKSLNTEDWKRIVEAGGDLSKALPWVITDKPVPHDRIVVIQTGR